MCAGPCRADDQVIDRMEETDDCDRHPRPSRSDPVRPREGGSLQRPPHTDPRRRRPARLWSQFWSHSLLSGAVRRRPQPPVRACHGRWRPVVNGGAQSSKACEGAAPPWVQIPPPPPLTCDDASPRACSVAAGTAVVSVLGHKWSQLTAPRYRRTGAVLPEG